MVALERGENARAMLSRWHMGDDPHAGGPRRNLRMGRRNTHHLDRARERAGVRTYGEPCGSGNRSYHRNRRGTQCEPCRAAEGRTL